MVLKGQFLERSVVVPSGGLSLDGLYHRGDERPACVLAAPHPALGGSMTAPVVAELAWQLTQAGHPTLRFDYRGVGASQGKSRHAVHERLRVPLGVLQDEAADLLAAVDQLLATTGARSVCAVGYSFGAGVVLACADDPRIERLVLVAPPTRLIDFANLQTLQKKALCAVAERDELLDLAALQGWLGQLGDRGTLRIIEGADHLFRRGLRELGHEVVDWVREGRPRPARDEQGEAALGAAQSELELDEGSEPPLELEE